MQFLGVARFVLVTVIALGVLAASVVAFADAAMRPPRAFSEEGKRTKRFWLLLLGAGLLFAVLGALSMISVVLNLAALIPAAAYWYDVRPAIKPFGTTRGGPNNTTATPKRPKPIKTPRPAAKIRAAKEARGVKAPDYYDPTDWEN